MRLLPSFPFKRQLPLVLLVVAAAALAWGLVTGEGGFIALGAIGLVGLVLGYGVSRVLGPEPADDDDAGLPRSGG